MILGEAYKRWLFFVSLVAVATVISGLILGWETAWILPAVAALSAVAHGVYDSTGIGKPYP